jgi:serine/threonine protein kinase
VYRDVKPENTLLCGSSPPTVALCDFGVARRFDAARGRLTTLAGTPCVPARRVSHPACVC